MVLTRIGIRIPLIIGPIFALAGIAWLTRLTPTSGYGSLILPLILVALGMGQCFVPLTVAAISGVANRDAGIASALLNTGQQVGGALGLSVLGTIAISAARNYASNAVHHHAVSPGLISAAATHGYTTAFGVGAGIMGAGLLISLLVIRVPAGSVATNPEEALTGAV